LVDTKGVVYEGRKEGMNPYKARFAQKTSMRTLADAVKDADVFVGLSVKGAFSQEMLRSMAKQPIVFAMANPDPEITYEDALAARTDVLMCTGRTDYPNQVNNVLGFPFIFRGALDVHATAINEEMKLAATRALAALAKEDVPDSVCQAYGVDRIRFGPEYIIPKPFDPRVLVWEASAVAKAAMESGVARTPVDLDEYRERLEKLLGKAHEVMRTIIHKAQAHPRRVVFPEGDDEKILRAAHILIEEKIAYPVVLGDDKVITAKAKDLGVPLDRLEIINPQTCAKRDAYVNCLYELRQRRGVALPEAQYLINNRNLFAAIMVNVGDADALVGGVEQHFPDVIRPALQVIKPRLGLHRVAGLYVLVTRRGDMYFLADCTVNIEPNAEDLAEIAICAAETARRFNVTPRVAMLSFSNFGSTKHPLSDMVQRAVHLVQQADPTLMVDGEMMADTAVVPEIIDETYPFSNLKGGANVLIFPDLTSANTCYKLLNRIGGVETIGPILMGMSKPVHVLQRGAEVEEIVNMAAIAVMDAQETEGSSKLRSASPRKPTSEEEHLEPVRH
jgi:malate dehydrogenase (oxaloacetate-decarboxylating)(NADP+)